MRNLCAILLRSVRKVRSLMALRCLPLTPGVGDTTRGFCSGGLEGLKGLQMPNLSTKDLTWARCFERLPFQISAIQPLSMLWTRRHEEALETDSGTGIAYDRTILHDLVTSGDCRLLSSG